MEDPSSPLQVLPSAPSISVASPLPCWALAPAGCPAAAPPAAGTCRTSGPAPTSMPPSVAGSEPAVRRAAEPVRGSAQAMYCWGVKGKARHTTGSRIIIWRVGKMLLYPGCNSVHILQPVRGSRLPTFSHSFRFSARDSPPLPSESRSSALSPPPRAVLRRVCGWPGTQVPRRPSRPPPAAPEAAGGSRRHRCRPAHAQTCGRATQSVREPRWGLRLRAKV